MFARLRSLSAALLRRRHFEDALRDEMQFHIDAYADDLVSQGVSRVEAERRARMEFGTVDALKDDCRQSRGLRVVDELTQDLRYAARIMRRTPAVTLAAIVSLALGIGANTAIFTLMDAVLLRTLPVSNPGELYFLAHGDGERPSTSSNYPLFERYAQLGDVFTGLTAYATTIFKVPAGDGVESISGLWTSGNFHATLGVPMALGRGFTAESDREPGGRRAAVISHGYWIRRFGESPDVLEHTLTVDGHAVSIVGVTAAAFVGLVPGRPPDITLPFSLRGMKEPEFLDTHENWTSMPIVGRLRPGVSEASALAATDVVFRQYMSEPENQWIAKELPESFRSARLVSAAKGSSELRQRYATPLTVLMTLVGLILLIASANVANLLLVRSESRVREIAIRLSIGCDRRRLIRQMLTESTLLAACGALVGFVIAIWGASAIVAFFASLETPILLDVAPNLRLVAFTTVVTLTTGLVFGLLPALRSTRMDLTPALKDGPAAIQTSSRRWTSGQVLLVTQLAVCVFVVAVAGLLGRSLYNLKMLDAGFDGERVLVFTLDSYGTTVTEDQRGPIYAELLDRLKALPGVVSVSASRSIPIHTSGNARGLHIPGAPETTEARSAWTNIVTPGYFDTFGIGLLSGRDFNAFDSRESRKVAIVNQTMARLHFGDRDPLGETFAFMTEPDDLFTVVGVTEDTYQLSLRDPVPRMVYTPLAQSETPTWMNFELRSAQHPSTLVSAARETVRAVSRDVVLHYVRTMDEQVNASLVRERLLAALSAGFAVLALVLAAVGLYGVMSYQVSRQSREIGIRIALGAGRVTVLWQILRQVLVVSVVGVVLGVVATLSATRTLSTLLYGLSPTDPSTLAVVSLLLLATALVAGFVPARRAATMDPVRAIRTE